MLKNNSKYVTIIIVAISATRCARAMNLKVRGSGERGNHFITNHTIVYHPSKCCSQKNESLTQQ